LQIPAVLLLTTTLVKAATVSGKVELTGGRSRNFAGVALWLEPVGAKAPHPQAGTHRILQKGKRFIPHVSVIPIGTTVDWPNGDPVFHNAFSNFAGQPFDTGLYPPGTTYKIRFVREGVVRVFCNIHSTMSAVIVVVDTPWYTTSASDGAFRIDNVPPGEYTLKIWHEGASEEQLKTLDRRLTVDAGGADAGTIRLAESRYPTVPHKNKYGRDYAPEPPERVPYGGRSR
jgi:plastocyanin